MENRPEDGDHEARNPIADLYRLAEIKRWHIVSMNQKQSVAEHSYFVTLLAMRFSNAIGAPVGRTVQYALLHDAEEAWTGDIPSPVKQYVDKGKVPIKEMMGDMAEDMVPHSPIVQHIVKICDMAESMKYLARHGNSHHTIQVKDDLAHRLDVFLGNVINDYPNFDWDAGLKELNEFYHNEETHIDDYIREDVQEVDMLPPGVGSV